MATVRDYDELQRIWTGWRNASGNKMRDIYQSFADLSNQAVKAEGKKQLKYWQLIDFVMLLANVSTYHTLLKWFFTYIHVQQTRRELDGVKEEIAQDELVLFRTVVKPIQ